MASPIYPEWLDYGWFDWILLWRSYARCRYESMDLEETRTFAAYIAYGDLYPENIQHGLDRLDALARRNAANLICFG